MRRHDIAQGAANTLRETWHLGFTAFGGPPVHFKIVSIVASNTCETSQTELTRAFAVVVSRQVYEEAQVDR